MIKQKYVLAIDLILIVGTVLIILGGGIYYSSLAPVLLSPEDNFIGKNVLFEFEKANKILIDDNLEFASPDVIYAEDNLVVNLKPGVYYWKVEGTVSSEVRKLTIESEVDLKIREKEDGYEVVNAGNTRLNVDVYEKEKYKESVKLGVGEKGEVSGTKFIGGQDE